MWHLPARVNADACRGALARSARAEPPRRSGQRQDLDEGATYAAVATAVPGPRWSRQPTWAAVMTATGPGSIWANANDSPNSLSDTHRLSRTTTSRICATIAGPP